MTTCLYPFQGRASYDLQNQNSKTILKIQIAKVERISKNLRKVVLWCKGAGLAVVR